MAQQEYLAEKELSDYFLYDVSDNALDDGMDLETI